MGLTLLLFVGCGVALLVGKVLLTVLLSLINWMMHLFHR